MTVSHTPVICLGPLALRFAVGGWRTYRWGVGHRAASAGPLFVQWWVGHEVQLLRLQLALATEAR